MRRQIAAARAAAAALEADDLDFARALAALRAPLVELGRRLAARGDLARADDVFFLALREAAEAVRAAPGTLVLPPRVAAARARWVERRLHPPAPELRGGVPHWPALTHAPTPAPAALPRTLVGVGASPGWAQGRACVLYAPGRAGALPPGAVLVVPAATPACSFLLPQAVALVTEHGGALSHAAILAREYGLPAVVAVPDALRAIPDGARLEVDGTRGTVTLID
jgi:pyruvate,water dikinase